MDAARPQSESMCQSGDSINHLTRRQALWRRIAQLDPSHRIYGLPLTNEVLTDSSLHSLWRFLPNTCNSRLHLLTHQSNHIRGASRPAEIAGQAGAGSENLGHRPFDAGGGVGQ